MTTDPKASPKLPATSFSGLSLRTKGLAVLSLPMTALFVALFSIYWAEGKSRDADLEVMRAYDTRAELRQLDVNLLHARAAALGYQATGEQRHLADLEGAREAIHKSVGRLRIMAASEEDRPIATAVRDVYEAAEKGLRGVGEWRTAEAAAAVPAPAELSQRVESMVREVERPVTAMNQMQELRLWQARSNREETRRKNFQVVVVCGILGPLGALLVHLAMAGRVVRRLQVVQENARRLAHGLPLAPLRPGTDEIASLARQIENAEYLMREREGELRESEKRYRDLFDRAPIAYEETDLNGVVRRFNQEVCALLKCPPERVLGRKAWEFVAPDQQAAFREGMLRRMATASEMGGPLECEYLLEDGSRIAVEIRESLIRNQDGEVTGICRSVMDVTERNVAALAARKVAQYASELRHKNEQLAGALDAARSATEAKSRFLASVSHELRTPLNGIIGFSELMHDGKLGTISEEQREIMGDILTSARHLLRLISDILDVSKVEAGKMEFHPEPAHLDQLVQEARDIVRPLADKKKLQITTDVPPGLQAVIDPARFKQVLFNYLSNAVKFTGSGGKVNLRVSLVNASRFRVDVEDTGIGIAPEEMPLLFNEFRQLPNSRKAEQGTGLGLALTRHIVEAQGGSVAARSILGKGSVFSAELPLNAHRG